MEMSRRSVLKTALAAGATTAVTPGSGALAAGNALEPFIIDDPRTQRPQNSVTEDMYRAEFAGTFGEESDHGFAFHCVNCQGNCAWRVWINDGKITRENQSASYPAINPEIPDFNPRGCNKGAQHSQIMYNEDRLKFPLRRAGERGSGEWQRISWDEAIDEVAQNIYQSMLDVGPKGNYIHLGAGLLSEARGASIKRLGTLLGAVRPYIASYVGDMFPGTSLVYGEGNIGCSFDFMYSTDVQVYWGCNPNVSRMPDAHFLWEGKYNGSKVVVITPEYNSTCKAADLWVPVRAGYDGHLAMAMMHEIVQERLFSVERAVTFTDLPMLVRDDTGTMLNLHDIDSDAEGFDSTMLDLMGELGHDELHEDEIFFAYDESRGKVTAMPGTHGSPLKTLRLRDAGWELSPVLELPEGLQVTLKSGERVGVKTVFELLKVELERFTPESTQALTGVHPDVVRTLARDVALPNVVSVTIGFSLGKHFNGLLTQRAISSLVALTGRLGRYGGMNTENEWSISGLGGLSGFDGDYKQRFASGAVSEFMLGDGFSDVPTAFSDEDMAKATGMNNADYKAELDAELEKVEGDEAVGVGKSYWDDIETFLIVADARLRRNKGSYKRGFLEKAKFFAYADFRMSETGMYADVLLPCRSHYEVYDLRTNPGYHRYANVSQPAKGLEAVGEAKSEWDIATLIVERLQAIAIERFDETGDPNHIHIPDATHSKSGFRELDQIVELFTKGGTLGTDKQAVEYALSHVDQFRGQTLETTAAAGGFLEVNNKAGKSSPLYPDQPYNTFENNLALHEPFETRSGRLTFHVDHPLWLEAGASVPTATEPLKAGKYPLLVMTPHARWSVHSTYKTSATLLRLQRGEPSVMVSPETADRRGIQDGDQIEMFNDLGVVQIMAKVSPTVPPGALVLEHGWEPFMFRNRVGANKLSADMLNLLEVSDGWGHLKFGVNWDGNQHAYNGAVDIRKVN